MKKRRKKKIKLSNELKQFLCLIPIVFIFVMIDVFKPSISLIIGVAAIIFSVSLLSYTGYLLYKNTKKKRRRKRK